MTTIDLQCQIPKELDHYRLDQALAKLFPQYSRSQYQIWIKSNQVRINQEIANVPRTKVRAGEEIALKAELQPESDWAAQALPLDIIFQDNAVIVINKPPGLVVHPGAGNPDQTLVNALVHHDPKLMELPRAGIIHRLDKDTSGLLVIARNLASHFALTRAMSQRQITRQYCALVHGQLISGGTVNTPIGRHPTQRTKMAVNQRHGKEAVTHYRIRERFLRHTLLDVFLETGRTHQIRVHLAHLGYPIVGDPVYGKPGDNGLITRQALHANQLSFHHPATEELLVFCAQLPSDVNTVLDTLRQGAAHND